jgi:FtsZ-binding cell division protein ZapB
LNENLTAERARLEIQISELKQKYKDELQEKTQEYTREITSLRQKNEELLQQNRNLEEKLTVMQTEINELKSKTTNSAVSSSNHQENL